MAATVEWSIPFMLTTPEGTLLLNQLDPTVHGYYLIEREASSSGRAMRVTRDNRAQASGESPMHPHFTGGYEMSLRVGLWETRDKAACNELLVRMWDFLMLHANALLGDDPVLNEIGAGRIQWSPSGASVDRMLDRISTLALPVPDTTEDTVAATLGFNTSYPYVMDAPEIVTEIADGATVTLTNTGDAAFKPVMKIHGPFSAFSISNLDAVDADGNPLTLIYDDALPGAPTIASGHYIELAFFNETAYVDGHVADAKPGIVITSSDFFPLLPGPNRIQVFGGDVDVLWQAAYA